MAGAHLGLSDGSYHVTTHYGLVWTVGVLTHYNDVIMGAITSQITSLNQRKHQSSASLAFVRWIHRGPVNSPHKWPVTRKFFPFDDVIMSFPEAIGSPLLNRNDRQFACRLGCAKTPWNSLTSTDWKLMQRNKSRGETFLQNRVLFWFSLVVRNGERDTLHPHPTHPHPHPPHTPNHPPPA